MSVSASPTLKRGLTGMSGDIAKQPGTEPPARAPSASASSKEEERKEDGTSPAWVRNLLGMSREGKPAWFTLKNVIHHVRAALERDSDPRVLADAFNAFAECMARVFAKSETPCPLFAAAVCYSYGSFIQELDIGVMNGDLVEMTVAYLERCAPPTTEEEQLCAEAAMYLVGVMYARVVDDDHEELVAKYYTMVQAVFPWDHAITGTTWVTRMRKMAADRALRTLTLEDLDAPSPSIWVDEHAVVCAVYPEGERSTPPAAQIVVDAVGARS